MNDARRYILPNLICHLAWMPHYRGEEDVHPGGFSEVRRNGYAHEAFNFLELEGRCYGFVSSRNSVINIRRLGAANDAPFVDGIRVIFTARVPGGERVVVGWYKEARVYRERRLSGRSIPNHPQDLIYHHIEAEAGNAVLIPINLRKLVIRHHSRGFPGQSPVFYPDKSDEIQGWMQELDTFIDGWVGEGVVAAGAPARDKGWPTTPDAAHNALVEAAAIARVRERYSTLYADRQRDNCGWDLEFDQDGLRLCIEVKGVSGDLVAAELSPNEYAAMRRAMNGDFQEGNYRLAIVTQALSEAPRLHVFRYDEGEWLCELTGSRIRATERVAASLG